jgi:hypothetical protein
MNITASFAAFFESISGSVLGSSLFIGGAPSSNKVQDNIWWLVTSGGSIITSNTTGENLKSYTIELSYRSRDYQAVYDELQSMEEAINCDDCVQLTDFETIDVKASILGIDTDLDLEDRKVGILGINITVYSSC